MTAIVPARGNNGEDIGWVSSKLPTTTNPGQIQGAVDTQADADAVFAAGWDEKALHDAIAVTARMSFMQRLVEGYGFKPWTREVAREHAIKRVKLGYVNLYPQFARPGSVPTSRSSEES